MTECEKKRHKRGMSRAAWCGNCFFCEEAKAPVNLLESDPDKLIGHIMDAPDSPLLTTLKGD